MRKTLLVLSVLVLSLASAQRTVPLEPGESLPPGVYTVARTIDGDTLVVTQGAVARSVRVIGLDTPELEPLQPFAREAAALTATLAAPGTQVYLMPDEARVDRFGRALAYVVLPSRMDLGLWLLATGSARAATVPPNTRMAAVYEAAADGARSMRKGLWAGLPGRFADRNCSAFTSYETAQAFFMAAQTERVRDAHRLDPDRDGRACQNLPRSLPPPDAAPSS